MLCSLTVLLCAIDMLLSRIVTICFICVYLFVVLGQLTILRIVLFYLKCDFIRQMAWLLAPVHKMLLTEYMVLQALCCMPLTWTTLYIPNSSMHGFTLNIKQGRSSLHVWLPYVYFGQWNQYNSHCECVS